jgi:hypothetical protein
MRISHIHRFLFLSNSQSGSSSIRKVLDPSSEIKSGTEFPYHHHTNARLLKKHFEEKAWDWDAYFKFTTVRNPWDRMVGRYHYGLGNPDSSWHEAAATASCFAEFLEHPFIVQAAPKTTLEHFAFARDGTCLVDEILKLEDLGKELPRVLKKLGLKVPRVPRVNQSSHKHYSLYYNDAARQRVSDWFHFDIEFGSYQFEQKEPANSGFQVWQILHRVTASGRGFINNRSGRDVA